MTFPFFIRTGDPCRHLICQLVNAGIGDRRLLTVLGKALWADPPRLQIVGLAVLLAEVGKEKLSFHHSCKRTLPLRDGRRKEEGKEKKKKRIPLLLLNCAVNVLQHNEIIIMIILNQPGFMRRVRSYLPLVMCCHVNTRDHFIRITWCASVPYLETGICVLHGLFQLDFRFV